MVYMILSLHHDKGFDFETRSQQKSTNIKFYNQTKSGDIVEKLLRTDDV